MESWIWNLKDLFTHVTRQFNGKLVVRIEKLLNFYIIKITIDNVTHRHINSYHI